MILVRFSGDEILWYTPTRPPGQEYRSATIGRIAQQAPARFEAAVQNLYTTHESRPKIKYFVDPLLCIPLGFPSRRPVCCP